MGAAGWTMIRGAMADRRAADPEAARSSLAGRATKRGGFRSVRPGPLLFLPGLYSADVSVSRSASPAMGEGKERT